jgi:hypothetical protein
MDSKYLFPKQVMNRSSRQKVIQDMLNLKFIF